MHCAAPPQGRAAPQLIHRIRATQIQRHIRLSRQHHVGAFEYRALILVAEQMHFGVHARAAAARQTRQIAAQRAQIRHRTRPAGNRFAVANVRVRQNDGAAEMALAQQQPNQPPGGQRRQREQAAGEQRVVRILVADLRHGGDEALAGVLADAHAHLFAQRNVFIPGLLQLAAPIRAMQDIVQRRHRFDH